MYLRNTDKQLSSSDSVTLFRFFAEFLWFVLVYGHSGQYDWKYRKVAAYQTVTWKQSFYLSLKKFR